MIHSSNSSTSGAQVVGAGSLLNTLIPTAVVQPSAQAVVLPYVGNLASGQYTSEIVAVGDAVQNGSIVGIDCTHKLTDSRGKTILVKFRYFAPSDIEALVKVLAEYGLTGGIGAALQGLQETVDIAPRPGSTRYVYISQRAISNATSSVTSAASITPTCVSTATTSVKSKVGLSRFGSKRSNTSSVNKTSVLSTSKNFDDWDDEDEDDYLDDED